MDWNKLLKEATEKVKDVTSFNLDSLQDDYGTDHIFSNSIPRPQKFQTSAVSSSTSINKELKSLDSTELDFPKISLSESKSNESKGLYNERKMIESLPSTPAASHNAITAKKSPAGSIDLAEAGGKIALGAMSLWNNAVSSVNSIADGVDSINAKTKTRPNPVNLLKTANKTSSKINNAHSNSDDNLSSAWGDFDSVASKTSKFTKPGAPIVDDDEDFTVEVVSGADLGLPSFGKDLRPSSSPSSSSNNRTRIVGSGAPSLQRLANRKTNIGHRNKITYAALMLIILGILWFLLKEFQVLNDEEKIEEEVLDMTIVEQSQPQTP
jgi:hypothetical protein